MIDEAKLSVLDGMTGAELKAAIEREAERRDMTPTEFAAPLSRWPNKWLFRLGTARQPKPATVARVRALFAGETVEAPPLNNFWKSGLDPTRRAVQRAREIKPEKLPPRVDRDPCPRCGVRGDVGCRHQLALAAQLSAIALAEAR